MFIELLGFGQLEVELSIFRDSWEKRLLLGLDKADWK